MLKSTPDMASPCGDALFVANNYVISSAKRSVVDVSLKSNRHILISSSSTINSIVCVNSLYIVSKADDI